MYKFRWRDWRQSWPKGWGGKWEVVLYYDAGCGGTRACVELKPSPVTKPMRRHTTPNVSIFFYPVFIFQQRPLFTLDAPICQFFVTRRPFNYKNKSVRRAADVPRCSATVEPILFYALPGDRTDRAESLQKKRWPRRRRMLGSLLSTRVLGPTTFIYYSSNH